MAKADEGNGSEDSPNQKQHASLLRLVGPGTLIADMLAELPAIKDRDLLRGKLEARLAEAIRAGELTVGVHAPRSHCTFLWHLVPSMLLELRLRLQEDEDANDGRSRYAVTVDLSAGSATIDFDATRAIANHCYDEIPGGDRVLPPPPGGLVPTPDDDVSRFLNALEKDGIVDHCAPPLLVRVDEWAGRAILGPLLSTALAAKSTERRAATEDETRAELESLRSDYEKSGKRLPTQKKRRSLIREQLRAKQLALNDKIFPSLDRAVIGDALGRGRPRKTPN
jgi:hypothetical protein